MRPERRRGSAERQDLTGHGGLQWCGTRGGRRWSGRHRTGGGTIAGRCDTEGRVLRGGAHPPRWHPDQWPSVVVGGHGRGVRTWCGRRRAEDRPVRLRSRHRQATGACRRQLDVGWVTAPATSCSGSSRSSSMRGEETAGTSGPRTPAWCRSGTSSRQRRRSTRPTTGLAIPRRSPVTSEITDFTNRPTRASRPPTIAPKPRPRAPSIASSLLRALRCAASLPP
jgi:hypothetical protein